ncbi:MAG: hypothetical protein WBL23_15935 [Salinisphaera sp.]|uniref:hypothetical protein n=1 Tax=Salinisphaera sp. TaxID=1914330 RepID=UPI003C7C8CA6
MKRLIVVLALALTGVGCTTYSPYGSVGYSRVYQSYGYGYPGYVAYPVYGDGYSYPIPRHSEHREYNHWRSDRWGDPRDIRRHARRPSYGHERGEPRHHGGPSMNENHWPSSGRDRLRSRTSWQRPAPGRSDFRHGMTRPGGIHHDARQR